MRSTSTAEAAKKLSTRLEPVRENQPSDSGLNAAVEKVFGPRKPRGVKFSALDESAKKAAPKLFFAGERTYLQWMHTGILLAGISMALGSHSEAGSVTDWISVFLLPVAIGIILHAMSQCEWNLWFRIKESSDDNSFLCDPSDSHIVYTLSFVSLETNIYDCLTISWTI